jgi:peptidoglycan-associated lipoprotein
MFFSNKREITHILARGFVVSAILGESAHPRSKITDSWERRSLMRFRSNAGALRGGGPDRPALYGCPKRPEVLQAGPAAVSPGSWRRRRAPNRAPRTAETPVTRTPALAETPVRPAQRLARRRQRPCRARLLKDVFFDYDKAGVRDDQKAVLNDNVGWLKGNTGAKILIEGHCDERGTVEYNLGLGERCAKAVKDYLIAAGIAADRVSTISYGRALRARPHESAWKWNRRPFHHPGK